MWAAEYADGTVVTEEEVGSVRNAPPGIITLAANGQTLPIPIGATPLWLRRVSLTLGTDDRYEREMIGYELGEERVEVWVRSDGQVIEEPD